MTLTLPGICEAWWAWMSAVSVQIVVLFIIVCALDKILRRWAWPQLLAAMWLILMMKLLVPPTLVSPVSVAHLAPQNALLSQPAAASQTNSVVPILFGIWIVGFAILSIWTCVQYRRTRRRWLGSPEIVTPAWLIHRLDALKRQSGVRRRIRLSVRLGAPGSAVIGFTRPVIIMPAAFVAQNERDEVEHVLLHELAHIKRRDPLAGFACLTLQLMYWFHPAVWIARSRLSALREICCDRFVTDTLGERSPHYRDTLLELARPWITRQRTGQLALIHNHSQLLHRLEWLERSCSTRVLWRRAMTLLMSLTLMLCCVPLSQPHPEPAGFDVPDPAWFRIGEGCMRTRIAVMQAIAAEEQAGDPLF